MKTREDAETALALFAERDELKTAAKHVLDAAMIAICDPEWAEAGTYRFGHTYKPVTFLHLAEEARELVRRETELRVAEIEAKLRDMGVEP